LLNSHSPNPFGQLSELLQQRIEAEATHLEYVEQAVDVLFDSPPVELPVFLHDKKYLALPPLSQMQYDFVEAGTQIYYESTLNQLGWKVIPYYRKLVAKWGKGSGKDTVSRIILARIAYLLTCLRDPQKYLDIMPGDSVNMLNVAYSAKQAQVIFFEPLKRLLEKSICFRNKIKPLEDHIEFEKNINLYSGHSEQESMEGHNLIAAVLDEIAAFKTNAELEARQRRSVRGLEHSAEALDDMVTSSATSRFPYLHKIMYISYTRFQGDYIEQKYDEGLANPETCFVSFGATWEVNPTKRREMFDEEYKKNPENAAARYECKPPKAVDAYFKHLTPELIAAVFPDIGDRVPLEDNEFSLVLKPWFRGMPGTLYFAHVDLGLSKNRAGLCVCHRAGFDTVTIIQTREDGTQYNEEVRLPRIKVDIWGSVLATPGGEVDLEDVRRFLFNIIDTRSCSLAKVTYDGFQSADSIQLLIKKGVLADVLSMDRDTKAYDTLKSVMYGRRLEAYYRAIGIDELSRLNIVTGNKVDHPLKGSKDEADALAGAVYNATEAEVSDSVVEDLALGASYDELFQAYHMDEQPGIWDALAMEGRHEH